jgi:hypothetical protein
MRATRVSEAELKQKLRDVLKASLRGVVVLRHEDHFTAGIPDTSITWKRRTTWMEAKVAEPSVKSLGVQKDTCERLAVMGYCWYVVYRLRRGVWTTLVVQPAQIEDLDQVPGECVTDGINHQFVVEFIRRSYDSVSA